MRCLERVHSARSTQGWFERDKGSPCCAALDLDLDQGCRTPLTKVVAHP